MSRRARLLASLSTTTLRAMLWTIATRTPFTILAEDIRNELLARDLPRLADETGGFPCARVEGVQ